MTRDRLVVTPSTSQFNEYLAAHGFSAAPEHVFRAVAAAALKAVSLTEPRLTIWGIGAGEPKRKPEGGRETALEYDARFRRERGALCADTSTQPFLLSLALVTRIPPTATIRSTAQSYKLKHVAENYSTTLPDGTSFGPFYVPNGLLIAASIRAGFRYRTYVEPSGYDGVNVTFNMSTRSVDDLDCEIRPNGATSQDRQRRRELQNMGFFRRRAKSIPI